MYIVASFEHSISIELAISDLEKSGIQKPDILALPLEQTNNKTRIFDTIHYSDGVSYIDLAAILGSIFMLLGSIYGFVLKQGPILWALYGLAIGAVIGFVIKLAINKYKYKLKRMGSKTITEVIIMVKCSEQQIQTVKEIFCNNHAFGISSFNE
ncbi:hypothetical protein ACFPYJ_15070 [Paenibacillus solisilvae]|uniref:Uncharacterized protein n=1 Tax=Paenibacillus solisilvae TaxID=2486751 RepID=A0ABW0W0C9_9BACL